MTKRKSTKRALLLSALSLLMCVSMLIGSTFAWFTDSVTSGNNKIVSGNLDVVLEYKNDWDDPWTVVEDTTKVFDQNALYEPGYTEVVYLRVSNAGSLALKYKLMVDIASEKGSTNVLGETFKLSEHLQIGSYRQDEYAYGANYADILMPVLFGSRESALSNVTLKKLSEADSVVESDLPVHVGDQSAQVLALVLTMPTTVGNEANHDTAYDAPEINLGISLLATQFTEEYDSFDNQYDKDADYIEYDHKVDTWDGLKNAFEDGGNILLTDDIALDDILYVKNSANVYLNMNGKTITAGKVNPTDGFLWVKEGGSLTIDGNGTFDLGANPGLSFLIPEGEVVIENGTFIREVAAGTDPKNVGAMFVGTKTGKLVINSGYFDGGYYDANAALAFDGSFTETPDDIAKRNQAGDANKVRVALKNNAIKNLNLSAENVKVYGGTFVGMNPAWGDEGCALPTTPNYLRPWSYGQGTFLEGQQIYDDRIEIPAGYTITEGTATDGRPTYTVNYSK